LRFIDKEKMLKFNVDEVLFIDTERKNLPFRQGSEAKVKTAKKWGDFEKLMSASTGLMKLEGERKAYYEPIKVIVIDSFTRILFLLSEFLDAQKIDGFSFWREYGKIIQKLLIDWESGGRFIVFTALEENVRDGDGIDTKCIKVDGKMLEGKVESFFSTVLHTHFNPAKQRPECYQFETNTANGKTTSKSADGMFKDLYIQNDMSFVLGSYYDYYKMKDRPEFVPSPIIVYGKSGSGKSTSFKYLFEEQ